MTQDLQEMVKAGLINFLITKSFHPERRHYHCCHFWPCMNCLGVLSNCLVDVSDAYRCEITPASLEAEVVSAFGVVSAGRSEDSIEMSARNHPLILIYCC